MCYSLLLSYFGYLWQYFIMCFCPVHKIYFYTFLSEFYLFVFSFGTKYVAVTHKLWFEHCSRSLIFVLNHFEYSFSLNLWSFSLYFNTFLLLSIKCFIGCLTGNILLAFSLMVENVSFVKCLREIIFHGS